MSKPTGIDQSWGYANPQAAKNAGVEVVMMYLSPDASKNATPAKVKTYLDVGIGVILGWESLASRALQGTAAGKADAQEASRQAQTLVEALGTKYKPAGKIVIYFAVDFDTNPSQYAQLDAYLSAAGEVLHPRGYEVGVYAEADYIEHTAQRKITDAEWQTYAWSGGQVAAAADFLQYLNGQTLGGASVDFDRIIHEHTLGAWWPPGHANDNPTHATDPMEDVMAMYKDKAAFEASLKQIVETAVNDRIDNLLEDYDGTPSRIRTFVRRIGPHGYVEPTAHPKQDDK
jgi:hypothetical protein